MCKLIIIRGNSGSGKTSLAKELQHKLGFNTMVISQDVIRREILWTHDGKDTRAIPLLMNLLQYGKQHSNIVILEGILYSKWYQPLFETATSEFGPNIYAYYYDLPFEETLNRHQTKPNRFSFGESNMREWWNEKDYIGFISEKTLLKDLSVQDVVELICRDISGD